MDAISPLVLPGDFEPGRSYLVKGATLIAWRKALQADRALVGPGLKEETTAKGRIFSALALAGAAATGTNANIEIPGTAGMTPRVDGYIAESVTFYIRNGSLVAINDPPEGDPPEDLIEVSFTVG